MGTLGSEYTSCDPTQEEHLTPSGYKTSLVCNGTLITRCVFRVEVSTMVANRQSVWDCLESKLLIQIRTQHLFRQRAGSGQRQAAAAIFEGNERTDSKYSTFQRFIGKPIPRMCVEKASEGEYGCKRPASLRRMNVYTRVHRLGKNQLSN